MVTPGLYKHYKGNMYRVLFVGAWDGPREESLTDSALMPLRIDYTEQLIVYPEHPEFAFITAQWSGNGCTLNSDDRIVVYVALYSNGRVSARLEEEFEEQVTSDVQQLTRPRFERIGD